MGLKNSVKEEFLNGPSGPKTAKDRGSRNYCRMKIRWWQSFMTVNVRQIEGVGYWELMIGLSSMWNVEALQSKRFGTNESSLDCASALKQQE